MVEIVAARVGFGWGWDLGEDGWNVGTDNNFRMSDVYTGLCIIEERTGDPGSPSDGDTYLVIATATGAFAGHAGKIAAYQDGAWYFYSVVKGLRALFVNHGDFRSYDGSAWVTEASYPRLPAEVQNIPMAFPFMGSPPAPGFPVFIPIVQDTDIPADLAGTIGYGSVIATADADVGFAYIRSGTTIPFGTVTFTSGGHLANLSTQSVVHLLAGDILVCTAPSPQDATLANFCVTLMAKKV